MLDVHFGFYHNNELLKQTVRTETVEEYLARGGKITECKTLPSDPNEVSPRTISEALRVLRETLPGVTQK